MPPPQSDLDAQSDAIRILDSHRIMAIATNRPDGWPQNTIVGYANVGLLIYFMVFQTSQKLANISKDPRVAIAVGDEPSDLKTLEAIYAGAFAAEVFDPVERDLAWKLLSERHPNLSDYQLPESGEAAIIRTLCKHVSVLNYRKHFGRPAEFAAEEPELPETFAADAQPADVRE
jgi:hypothetical protein